MFESSKPLSVNSHETVLDLRIEGLKPLKALETLTWYFNEKQIPFPQILKVEPETDGTQLLITGPLEIMRSIEKEIGAAPVKILLKKFSTVTMTCTGSTSPQLFDHLMKYLDRDQVTFHQLLVSAMSVTLVVAQDMRHKAVQTLHSMMN